jgi:hypothetical protein
MLASPASHRPPGSRLTPEQPVRKPHRRMIGGSARRVGRDAVEADLTHIDRIHESIDHPNGIVLVDPVIQALGKQGALRAIHALDETLHPIPRNSCGIHTARTI